MTAERDKLEAELDSLSKDIDASKSKLKMLSRAAPIIYQA